MSRISSLYDAYLRKAPRQSRSRSVVEAVLGAASERLSRSGDEADVSLQDIAKRAGVGIGSLYDYFRDRRSLLAALAAKVTEDNLDAFQVLLAKTHDLPLNEACGLLVDFCFETYASNKRSSGATDLGRLDRAASFANGGGAAPRPAPEGERPGGADALPTMGRLFTAASAIAAAEREEAVARGERLLTGNGEALRGGVFGGECTRGGGGCSASCSDSEAASAAAPNSSGWLRA